jgi:uncharacterized repeat protein (TIGR03803 family)
MNWLFLPVVIRPIRSNPTPNREGKIMNQRGNWKSACIVFVFFVATASLSHGQTFTTLASFNGLNDGAGPAVSLAQGIDGNLHGTTKEGGLRGSGTAFEVTPSGTLTEVHYFCGKAACTDGGTSVGGLVQGLDTDLYGTASTGGLCSGCGTVFEITTGGTVITLHSFSGDVDGGGPRGGVIQASNGNLYGTTSEGTGFGYGTIFEMTPSGTVTTLHAFQGTDGEYSVAELVQATDGNLYGTTEEGGANGYGTIFKITLAGTFTTLHSFDGTDGFYPQAQLVQGSDGNFYGTTTYGGANNICSQGCGTVFRITSLGAFTTLHSFDSTDGQNPQAGLVQATDGNLYGATSVIPLDPDCVTSNCLGTIFKITTGGTFTTVHSFTGGLDGEFPVGGLMQATNGILYGTTYLGGASSYCNNGCGTVYSLALSLAPFVKTLPTIRSVGQSVVILGTDLTGATSVTFNDTPATFTVVSATEITTKVPTGATSGTVVVTTPSGTLSSNVVFTVP